MKDALAYALSLVIPADPLAALPLVARSPETRKTIFCRAYQDRSRYQPHQGAQECARRRQRAA